VHSDVNPQWLFYTHTQFGGTASFGGDIGGPGAVSPAAGPGAKPLVWGLGAKPQTL